MGILRHLIRTGIGRDIDIAHARYLCASCSRDRIALR